MIANRDSCKDTMLVEGKNIASPFILSAPIVLSHGLTSAVDPSYIVVRAKSLTREQRSYPGIVQELKDSMTYSCVSM